MSHRVAASAALLCAALALVGEQAYLAAKASLAELLIDRAWATHLRDGGVRPPWSRADTHPVARLEVPRLGVGRIVLAGAGGSSLAFGPGHVDGTARPNAPGNCALAGHRDTAFAFLGEVRVGDTLWLQTRELRLPYRVTERSVRSKWDPDVLRPTPRQRRLTLITCWPLDGRLPGPERLVVVAVVDE